MILPGIAFDLKGHELVMEQDIMINILLNIKEDFNKIALALIFKY